MTGYLIASVSALSLLLVCALALRRNAPQYLRPPGPKPLLLIGNALHIPKSRGWLTFTAWGRLYESPLLFASAFGQSILVINSLDHATELLENRAQITSGRPMLPLMKMIGWEDQTAIMPYGEGWRRHRKVLHQHLRKEVLDQYHSVITQRSHELLRNMASEPAQFMEHCRLYAAAVLVDILYGYDIASSGDHWFLQAKRVIDTSSVALLPGAFAVNNFPFLRHIPRWFPGAGFHDFASKLRDSTIQMRDIPYDFAKNGSSKGIRKASLVGTWLQEDENQQEHEAFYRDLAFGTFGAGFDTTSASLMTLIHALVSHPRVQRKAQEQISQVLGSRRLPNLQDRPYLPYLEAIYREVLRWRPPLPLGFPHQTTRDDMYNGYHIPENTVVLPNIWAMTRNESIYSDPEDFLPERFFLEDGSLNHDDRVLAYGFGRRICPGKYLASDALWLAMAQLIATLEFSKLKDTDGNDIEPDVPYTDEAVSRPSPFKCNIVLRQELEEL